MNDPKPSPAIALVDVRCMFVSCERMIDSSLERQPVIVLSNNDGCAVSRSDEAKALGVKMGQPWFSMSRDPQFAPVIARSSNYELYGDMSCRFSDVIATLAATVETYSIDESFVEMPAGETGEALSRVQSIQSRVRQWIGLPTSAGIGTTKTLAKVAQRAAKARSKDVADISGWPRADIDELLSTIPTVDLWGVGNRLAASLDEIGIRSALELARADPVMLRRRHSVVLERTVRELNGVPCIPLATGISADRQQMCFSRMFGKVVTDKTVMANALADYAAAAGRRLRAHGLEASLMQVWISTSRFRSEHWSHSAHAALDPPTGDPRALIRATRVILPLMEEGRPYNRAGVLLTGLRPAGQQPTLWGPALDGRVT